MANKRIKDLATAITSFRTDDYIVVDGMTGTAKMGKNDLLQETAKAPYKLLDVSQKFLEYGVFDISDVVTFEQGSISGSGQLTTSSTRIRTELFSTSQLRCIRFSVETGYKFAVEEYNAEGLFVSDRGFTTSDFYYFKRLQKSKIRVLLAKTDNSEITPSDSSNLKMIASTYVSDGITNNEASIKRISADAGSNKLILDYNDFKVGDLALNGATPEINNLFPSRVSSVNPYYLTKNSIISVSDYANYSFYVYYSADGVSYTDKGRKHSDFYCDADGYYLVCINAEPTEVYQSSVIPYVNVLSVIPATTKEQAMRMDTLETIRNIHIGSINSSGIDNESNPTIRRRCNLCFAPKGSVLCVPKDLAKFYFQIGVYGDTVTFSDWKSEHYFESDTYFKLIIRKVDNTAFTSADETDFKQLVRFVASPKNKYDELRKHNVRSVCHAGINGAPPNTIPSFLEAYLAGYDVMECDARRTKDGVWVLCHNATINATARNPDGSEISGDVAVADTNYSDLLVYDFGIAYGAKYAGTKIPTCAEAYKLFRDLDVEINVDIASYPAFSKSEIHELMDVVNDAGMHDRVFYLVTSGYASFIIEKDDTANLAYTSNAAWWELASTCLTGKNAVILNADYTTLTTAKLDAMKAHGMPCEVWTIPNETAMSDVSDPYITGITSATVVAGKYYKKSTNVDTQNFEIPTAFLSRASSINGGFNRIGDEIIVDLNFVADYSATNSPSVLSGFPTPSDNMIVECVGYDSGTDTINNASAIINTSGHLQLNQTISGCKYYVKCKYKV